MLFNSLAFLIFLPIAFTLFWITPGRQRWIVLLALSYYFYFSGNPAYVLLLLATSFVIWGASVLIGKNQENTRYKKAVFASALILCIGLLAFFKYYNFAATSLAQFLSLFAIQIEPHLLKLMMPLGISFYTFQSAGYLIDVYNGKIEAEKNFARFALFVSFFPQIIAGPIGRGGDLLQQLKCDAKFDYDMAVTGLRMMLWGFFKKLIISDGLSKFVDRIYGDVHSYAGLTLIAVCLMYALQIYCDFSGYSDIAIGTARLFGIRLTTNFRNPYFAGSIREFWGRWHISLSTWFRDYLYIPMGGNCGVKSKTLHHAGQTPDAVALPFYVKRLRKYRNIMVTMLVSGLWHGASWTFVIWGGLHGVYQVIEGLCRDFANIRAGRTEGSGGSAPKDAAESSGKRGASRVLHVLLTFGLVTIAWIFFRADSVGDAFYVLTHLVRGLGASPASLISGMMAALQITPFGILKLLGAIAVLFAYDLYSEKHDIPAEFSKVKLPLRWAVYVGLTVLIIITKLHGGTTQSFIYFRF